MSNLKKETIEAYGGRCVDCGDDDVRNLQLDHINNSGAAHRRGLLADNRRSGAIFYRALKKLGFPNKDPYFIEVVCRSCHQARTRERAQARREAKRRDRRERRREAAKQARAKLRAWAKRKGILA